MMALLDLLRKKNRRKINRNSWHFSKHYRTVFAVVTIGLLIASTIFVNIRQLQSLFADACPVGSPAYQLTEGICVRYDPTSYDVTDVYDALSIDIDSANNAYMVADTFSGIKLLHFQSFDYGNPGIYDFPGGASSPRAIAVADATGDVFIINQGSEDITYFPGGDYLNPVVYSLPIGSSGPVEIGVDSSGNAYTVNQGSHDISIFSIADLSNPVSYPLTGSDFTPVDIFVRADGAVYTANSATSTVTYFPPGDYLNPVSYSSVLGTLGSITVDASGQIYLGSDTNDSIEILDNFGNSITSFSTNTGFTTEKIAAHGSYIYAATTDPSGSFVRVNTSTYETMLVKLTDHLFTHRISDIKVNSAGNVFVSARDDNNEYYKAPFHILTLDQLVPNVDCPTVSPLYEVNGSRCERYLTPPDLISTGEVNASAVYVDANGTIYTANNTYPYTNTSISIITQPGFAANTYSFPNNLGAHYGIYADVNGVYATNYDDGITYFPTGNYTSPTDYPMPGDLNPASIVGDSLGNIYTANEGTPTITMFPAGDFSNPISYDNSSSSYSISIDAAGYLYTINTDNTFSVFNTADLNNPAYYSPSDFNVNLLSASNHSIGTDTNGNVYVSAYNGTVGFYGVEKFTRTDANFPFSYDGGTYYPLPYGYYTSQLAVDPQGNVVVLGSGGNAIRLIPGVEPVYQIYNFDEYGSGNKDVVFDSDNNFYLVGDSSNIGSQVTKYSYDFIPLVPSGFSLTSVPNPSNVGQNANFNVTGAITPGLVELREGSTVLGSQLVDISGNATLPISTLPYGVHNLRAYQVSHNSQTSDADTGALWSMDEGSGPTIFDSSSYGLDASLGFGNSFEPGINGSSLYNDGGSSGASVVFGPGDPLAFDSGDRVTIELWLKVDALNSDVRLIENPTSGGFGVEISNTGDLRLISFGGASVTWMNAVEVGVWNHYAITYDGATEILYKNGQQVLAQNIVMDWTNAGGTLYIGGDPDYPFQGYIDELRISIIERTASEIFNNAQSFDIDSTPVHVHTVTSSLIPTNTNSYAVGPNPAYPGTLVTVGADVTDAITNLPVTSGSIRMFIDSTDMGVFPVDGNGQVLITSSTWNAGYHFIHGEYLGTGTHLPSSSAYPAQIIYAIPTFTTLTSSLNPSNEGNLIDLTAHVTAPFGGPWPTPQGTVYFRNKDVEIGFADVDINGDAVIQVNLPAGIHHLRAYYQEYDDVTPIDGTQMWRRSTSETLFQQVNANSVLPPPGPPPPDPGPIGTSDFNTTINGRDHITGSVTQTKVNSVLDWVVTYNNLGPNANPANIYFPIKDNEQFVVGSLEAPVDWEIGYSSDFTCDDGSFTYTPAGANGDLDPNVKCIRFLSAHVTSPATRSDLKYITSSSDVGAINIAALGGRDVWKVDVHENKLFYFNHHAPDNPWEIDPQKLMFCFDLEINDTCVSNNPNIVYPFVPTQDGNFPGAHSITTSNQSSSLSVGDKLYFPFSNSDIVSGHGIICWDIPTDNYCNGSGFNSTGQVLLNSEAYGAWGYGNMFDIVYNEATQELYSLTVANGGFQSVACFSLVTNAPCVGQPYSLGFQSYDPAYGELLQFGDKLYTSGGPGSTNQSIACLDLITRTPCAGFVNSLTTGRHSDPFNAGEAIFNMNGDLCTLSSGGAFANVAGIYCYNEITDTFDRKFAAEIPGTYNGSWGMKGTMPPGRIYFGSKFANDLIQCLDTVNQTFCPGWETGKHAPFGDIQNYNFTYAFGCMWDASDSGRVMPLDLETGELCTPTFTQSNGSSTVAMDATNISCDTPSNEIAWNIARVLDSGTTPSPVFLNGTVYDESQCSLQTNGNYLCSGVPLKTANLLLNSNHSMDISDISYELHPSLVFVISFQYPSVPTPAPAFYLELNPSNTAQVCAQTKLVFSGAICSNPISNVCEASNIAFVNDPISSNNTSQDCLNVETYFGKDPNSSLCFVDTTGTSVFKVTSETAVVAPAGEQAPVVTPDNFGQGGDGTGTGVGPGGQPGTGNAGFGDFFSGLGNIVNEETLRQVITSVNVQTPLAITAVTAATVATIFGTSLLTTTTNIGQIIALFIGFFSASRRKYWGIVIDEITNKPVPFASITLTKKDIGRDNQVHTVVISQTVTDLEGKYRLNTAQRDNFFLEVRASGYQVYYKFVRMDNPLASSEDIVYDIALKRIDSRINPIQNFLSYQKTKVFNILKNITLLSAIIGFIATIYTQITGGSLLNLALIGLYLVMFVSTIYPKIYAYILKKGYILDKTYKKRIAGAVVRIYDARQQIALSLSNSKGEVRFDLQPGDYAILASKKSYEMITPEGGGKQKLLKAKVLKEGYLDKNVLMNRVAEVEDKSIEGLLENPFGN